MKKKTVDKTPNFNIDDLILEGINITRVAQEGDAIYSDNQLLVDEVHRRYQLWVINIRNWFGQEGYNARTHPLFVHTVNFYRADSVPLMKGGVEYGDPTSPKSQLLLKNIREEATKKLEHLDVLIKLIPTKKKRALINNIESIVCAGFEVGEDEFRVIINDSYKKPLLCKSKIFSWKVLYEIAKEKSFDFSSEDKEKVENTIDYFNNNKNNKIYSGTHLNLTRILKLEGESVLPTMSITLITEKEFKKRSTLAT